MHLKGSCTHEARELLAAFHHHNLETVVDDTHEARLERERQWAALLGRIDELGLGNRNVRIFPETIEQAIAECWRLPIVTPPPAAPSVTAQASPATEPPIDTPPAEAPAWPAILPTAGQGDAQSPTEG